MSGPLQGPQFFEAPEDELPEGLSVEALAGGGAGRVVAFVSSAEEGVAEWGARAVVDVAMRWAEQGIRVFLADLDLEHPRLHDVVGVENGEGVADAFRFGASVQRIANRVGSTSFFFAPAGTPIGDATEIFTHPRWDVLVQGFEEAGATLLLYVPEDIAGRAEVLAKATDVVWMAPADAAPASRLGGAAEPLLAWIAPSGASGDAAATAAAAALTPGGPADEPQAPGSGAEESAGVGSSIDTELPVPAEPASPAWEDALGEAGVLEPTFADGVPDFADGFGDALDADLRSRSEDTARLAPVGSRTATPRSARRKSRAWLVWPGLAAVVILAGWQLWSRGLLPFGDPGAGGAGGEPGQVAAEVSTEDPPTAQTDGQVPVQVDPSESDVPLQDREGEVPPEVLGATVSPLLPYSLVLRSTPDPSQAGALADRLSEAIGDLLFIVAPASVNGAIWYRIMAGPAADASEIDRIRERVAETGIVPGQGDWFRRATGLAFSLGEHATVDQADAAAGSLRARGIPAYVLQVDYQQGATRFHIYAGGYATAAESEPLRRTIESAGERPELIDRVGRLPR